MNQASSSISKSRIVSWSFVAITLLLSQAIVALLVHKPDLVLTCNRIALLAVLAVATWMSAHNALSSDRSLRLFWVLVAGSSGLWALYSLLGLLQISRPAGRFPGPLVGGTLLFLVTAMLLAAMACRPHLQQMEQGTPGAALNSLLLLSFWIFVYVVLVISGDFPNWNKNTIESFAIVYSVACATLAVVTAALAFRTHGQWKPIYVSLFGTAAICALDSVTSGSYLQLPSILSTAAAFLLVRAAMLGRGLAPEPRQPVPVESGPRYLEIFPMVMVTVVPLFCVLELLRKNEPGSVRTLRLLAVLAAGLLFTTTAFIRVYFIHRRLARDIELAHDRLYLAMQSGKSITWDLNVASGEGLWFGDLETFFGIPATSCFLPVQQFYRSIYPEDGPRVSQAIADALYSARPFVAIFRIVLPNQALIWVKSHGRFYYKDTGEATRMLGIAVDINQQKQAESALWETESRFRNVADRAPVLLWMSARDQLCDYFNTSWLDFTGRDIADELGSGWMGGIHPDDRERYIKTCGDAFAARTPFSLEYRLRRHDGEYRWILANAVPRFALGNEFEGYIGSAVDVTDVKRAEEALQKSDEEFSLAFEAAHLGWWVWNEETWQVSASDGTRAVFGLPFGSEATLQDFLNSIHPEDRERTYAIWRQAIEKGSYFLAEYRTVWPDGTIHWVESRGRTYRNSQGKPAQMVGVIMEITERKRAEETLRTVSGRLIAAQEEERVRIARELHDDVCQRLAVITMELERMKEEPQLSEPRLQRWADRLSRFTAQVADDLQALSHELHSSKLEILGTTATMKSFCTQFAEQHHLQVEFTSSNVPFALSKDVSICLYRILQEGLRNAAKHSKAQRLFVELRGDRGAVELMVRDSGVGFDPEKVAQSRGLGLVSMRERVNLIKGSLSIETRPQRGTTIRARVPVEEMNAARCA